MMNYTFWSQFVFTKPCEIVHLAASTKACNWFVSIETFNASLSSHIDDKT